MIPVTFNGIQLYYLVKEIDSDGCVGCHFEHIDNNPCGNMVDQLPKEHRCGNAPGIYIKTDEDSVASYMARRLT